MAMDAKRKQAIEKPKKPAKDFPLYPHSCGQWAKTIDNRKFYFGLWENPKAALARYKAEVDFIRTHGRRPEPIDLGEGVSVYELCLKFREWNEQKVKEGGLSNRSFDDYRRTSNRLISIVGDTRVVTTLTPDDFKTIRVKLFETMGNRAVSNEIGRMRMIFKFGVDQRFIPVLPAYGVAFKKPSKKTIRADRRDKPQKIFTPAQLRKLIDKANQPLKAMILIGINSGMGNADIARLQHSEIDFKTGWIDAPRHKTENERRFHMWPETVAALKEAIALRPAGGVDGEVFCTLRGESFFKDSPDSPISKKFRLHLQELGLYVKGVGFYALRHCFETFAANAGMRQLHIDFIMGHCDQSMAREYREFLSDKLLKSVTNAVHKRVFGRKGKKCID